MKTTTLTAMKAVFDTDPARSRVDAETLLRTLGLNTAFEKPSSFERMVSFEEAAQRLNRTTATVHTLARRGILHKVMLPGFERASGVLASDLDRLLKASANGEVAHA